MVDRVRYPGVERQAGIAEIDLALFIENDIFQERVTADGAINFRFVLFTQVTGLGVASALKIENPVIIPAVFVITDQAAICGGGQRCLAGTRQPEKQRHITIVTKIGGTVHGGNALLRQQVVHHGEHALFHLTAIPAAGDQLHPLGQVKGDQRGRVQPLFFPMIILGHGGVDDGEIRREIL